MEDQTEQAHACMIVHNKFNFLKAGLCNVSACKGILITDQCALRGTTISKPRKDLSMAA